MKDIFLHDVDPQLIFITGSSITGAIDEYSDVDLGVVTLGRLPICSDICNVYWDGRHIHAFVHDLESFTRKRKTYIYCVGLFKANYLTKDDVLYSKDDAFTKDFLKNRRIPAGIGIHQFDDIFHEYVRGVAEDGLDPEHGIPKFLATAVEISYYLEGEPVESHVGFVTRVKRMHEKGLSQEDAEELHERLKAYLRLVPEFRKSEPEDALKAEWAEFRRKYEAVIEHE